METVIMRTSRWLYTWPVILCLLGPVALHAQVQSEGEKALLAKARSQEARGRQDLALDTWKQVLLVEPNNAEALAGAARADVATGNNTEAHSYLERLRAINPDDPQIARIESMNRTQAASPKLTQAGKLAESGQYAQAMAIYRQEFGNNPPAGDIALGYYETEAATEDGRPAAIAGLRDMARKYPNDPRYEVALGRILTYNPKTRPEGVKILEQHPNDPTASEALRQALTWDAANPGTAPAIRAYLKSHPDADLEARLKETEMKQARVTNDLARTAEERAAYASLAANKTSEAEQRFEAILAKEPNNFRALAGMGFVRMKQSNFAEAASDFEKSQANGGHDHTIAQGLDTARFYAVMAEASAAANNNQLDVAQRDYQRALEMRPNSPDALDGIGGLMLKEQQPAQAVGIYSRLAHLQSNSVSGWRGLFTAEYQSGDPRAALATVGRFPTPVRVALAKDPDYLRTLAAAYQAVGRDADAQRVLEAAMSLPFPNGGQGMSSQTQMQYAALLMEANRAPQAVSLYRQILVSDPNNVDAYEGLVRAMHASGQDAQALDIAERMPQDLLAKAEKDPGFLATLASIYQSQNHLDTAQQLLEQAIAASQTSGQPAPVGLQLQLASIYMARGNAPQAYAIYQAVLSANPNRPDAWKGLISALHTSDRDREALAEVGQIPAATLSQLNQDPQYLQVIASVYSGVGMNSQALATLHQISLHYQQTGQPVPADVDIQYAYMLMNADDNQDLYTLLMSLGSRQDLTVSQRADVQKVWALWSVRRANAEAKRGNYRKALQILDAANHAFPNNPDVQKALAGGYQQAGDPKRAEAVYLQMDWSNASLPDYRAAISAALAAGDKKQARVWLDPALHTYPNDPTILQLAAQYEEARGDSPRAAEYYKASLDAMGPNDPSSALVSDLTSSGNWNGNAPPPTDPSQRLASLLAPPGVQMGVAPLPPISPAPQPFIAPLPGSDYTPGQAPIQIGPNAGPVQPMAASRPMGENYADSGYTTRPIHRHKTRKVSDGDQPMQSGPSQSMPAQQPATRPTQSPAPAQQLQQAPGSQRLGDYSPSSELHAPGTSHGGWTVRYASWSAPAVSEPLQQASGDSEIQVAPNARLTYTEPFVVKRDKNGKVIQTIKSSAPASSATPQTASGTPGKMHLHMPGPAAPAPTQSAAATPRPVENVPGISYLPTAKDEHTRAVQYTQQSAPTQQQQQAQAVYNQSQAGNGAYSAPATGQNYTAAAGQNYPQAGNGSVSQTAGSPYNPNYGTGYTGYNDYRLPVQQQPAYTRELPPLSGGYSYQDQQLPRRPLSERERVENELDRIQGGYSPWLGASAYVSYRSGQAGLDRLLIFAAPVEGSMMLNDAVRLTAVVKPVVLDSGTQSSLTPFQLGSQPNVCKIGVTCTFYSQTASGIGGELQLRTQNYGASVGYTPGGFLVGNIIGSFYARPASGPFTFTFSRDSVIDTQLSYAGLADPYNANATSTYQPVWGGVIANAFEFQFASGTDRTGFYAQGGGQYITGKHVPTNYRGDGDAGAYWRIKDFPGYGGLTLGANVFAMHYDRNLRYFTYGQGGYFSPDAYLLANIPVTFYGHSGRNFHYRINGSLGVQAFTEDASPYYPLDLNLQDPTGAFGFSCKSTSANCYPARTSVSGNYLIDAEAAYRITDHWYFGGFVNANNSRDYNTATVGFFVRYMFRSQYASEEGPPTGIFPVNGLRPVLVP